MNEIQKFSNQRSLAGFEGSPEDLLELFVLMQGMKEIARIVAVITDSCNKIDWVRACPDGMIGGKGYIISVSELRKSLAEILAMAAQNKHSLADECFHNPFWKEIKEKLKKDNLYTRKEDKEDKEDKQSSFPAPRLNNPPIETPSASNPPEPYKLDDKNELEFEFVPKASAEQRDLPEDVNTDVSGITRQPLKPQHDYTGSDEDAILESFNRADKIGATFLSPEELFFITNDLKRGITPIRFALATNKLVDDGKISFDVNSKQISLTKLDREPS